MPKYKWCGWTISLRKSKKDGEYWAAYKNLEGEKRNARIGKDINKYQEKIITRVNTLSLRDPEIDTKTGLVVHENVSTPEIKKPVLVPVKEHEVVLAKRNDNVQEKKATGVLIAGAQQMAIFLGVGRKYVYQMLRDGRLEEPAYRSIYPYRKGQQGDEKMRKEFCLAIWTVDQGERAKKRAGEIKKGRPKKDT